MMLNPELLETERAELLPERHTMAIVNVVAFVFAPSRAVVVISRASNNSAVAIAGASISITQVASG